MRPKEIKRLIELVETSGIQELEVSRFGKKVRIRKNSGDSTMVPSASSSDKNTNLSPPSPVQSSEQSAVTTVSLTSQPDDKNQAHDQKTIEVRSPMVGTFYRSPAPDADPYVQVGDIITPNQVLCIIEAMKLMNEIESEFRGRIIDITAENGKPIEYDQVLFKIEKL